MTFSQFIPKKDIDWMQNLNSVLVSLWRTGIEYLIFYF